MSEKRIADLFQIGHRYLRSVQLERDFHDSTALRNYVLTDFTKSCFYRIAEGLNPDSGQRAWRITGDYGSGKSSFALFLAHYFVNHGSVPQHLRQQIELPKKQKDYLQYTPILCTCSRQPLGLTIIQALQQIERQLYSRGKRSKLALELESVLSSAKEPTEEQTIALIQNLNSRIISDEKSKGMLLIIDELGKYLEYVSVNTAQQDVFLLQRLAETASRSGNQPLMVVCLLHQGFNAYAEHLNQQAQREWEKVAGRFEEIVFNQPVEQITYLIASALGVQTKALPNKHAAAIRDAMRQTLDLPWFGPANKRFLVEMSEQIYPLHPTVIPVLIRIFKRFGQNERSLFSFLLSNEPFGLQSFCNKQLNEVRLYQLHDLYDYVRINFGHRLSIHSYRSHWNLIESVIESYTTDDITQINALKTIGILNLLNDDLLSTEPAIACALMLTDDEDKPLLKKTLTELRSTRKAIYDRGHERGYCLWPHTSVDIEKAYEETRTIPLPQRVAPLIMEHMTTRPIVARRHYIETGNLRYFDIHYCSVDEMGNFTKDEKQDADGQILVPLCETASEHEEAVCFAKSGGVAKLSNWLIAVPQALGNMGALIQEVQRWDWVASHTIELNGDKYAREEVSRQRQAAKQQLYANIQSRVGVVHFGGQTSLEWFHLGLKIQVNDGKKLLSKLSDICDHTYSDSPCIQNELVNRRFLSSAAAAARMRLIERMFIYKDKPFLGMNPEKKPPEMSMYLSVLQGTGIHEERDGIWQIKVPSPHRDKRYHILPSLKKIGEILREKSDTRINVSSIFSELKSPPYGCREGIIPLFLTVFAVTHEHDVAFYKEGTFIPEMTSEIMLELTKAPERFEIQYCKIEGVKADIYKKLLSIINLDAEAGHQPEILDVVKPLCVFVAQLPAYVHNTKKLTPLALNVRDTIMAAREPSKLLFVDLPAVSGLSSFSTQSHSGKEVTEYVHILKSSLDQLRAAYPELQDRMRKDLRVSFDLPGTFQQFRTTLASRAEQTVLGVTEPKLRAFCLRLMDDNLPESEWLESIGSFLALKPPAKWVDAEEDLFHSELGLMAERFRRVESIVFSKGIPAKGAVGVRLAITHASGTEFEEVIHYSVDEESRLHEMQAQFEKLFSKDKRLALVAASKAICAQLGKKGETKK